MDIKRLQPEAEVTYELETTGKPISVMFKVGYLALDAVPDYVNETRNGNNAPRLSEIVRKAVADAIRGWDLTENGQPLPCTRENKDKYLPLLFGLKIKQPKAEPGELPAVPPGADILVQALVEFTGNSETFLRP